MIFCVTLNWPQLDTLTLRKFQLVDEQIRIENVTTLIISYAIPVVREINFEVPHLQNRRLQLDFFANQFEKHYKFLRRNNHLSYHSLTGSQFRQLTANLTNPVELTL